MSSLEAAKEIAQQKSQLVKLVTENHNMAQEIVQLTTQRDALDKKVFMNHSAIQCIKFDLDFWNALVEKKNEAERPVVQVKSSKRKGKVIISLDSDDSNNSSVDATPVRRSVRRKTAN